MALEASVEGGSFGPLGSGPGAPRAGLATGSLRRARLVGFKGLGFRVSGFFGELGLVLVRA